MSDRRSITRWQVGRLAKLKLEGAQAFIDCTIQDINLKGIRVALATRLLKDIFTRIEIVLSDTFTLNVEVWVAWQRQVDRHFVYGLYFTKIRDQDKERIYRLLRNEIPQQINKSWWQEAEKGGEVMTEGRPEDKRVFERFSVNLPVRFLGSSANEEVRAQTQDISAKGIGLITRERLPVNSSVEMWLEIPDRGEPLYTRGEIVWSKSTGIEEYRSGINLEKADLLGLSRVLRVA